MSQLIKNNSDYIFIFDAKNSNPNGSPDNENKPRMDYETMTLLVNDARRKRDIRDFLSINGYSIFVNMLDENKVSMENMFNNIYNKYVENNENHKMFLEKYEKLMKLKEDYEKIAKDKKAKKGDIEKAESTFKSEFIHQLVIDELIDIRLFGSAMAIGKVDKQFTGPIQMSWGYSLHPVELVKDNAIVTIMNDDNSTFGKKEMLYYALVAHCGTINKLAGKKVSLKEDDLDIFRKALVQGLLANQTNSKQGQRPLLYLEIVYKEEFSGYLGDLRRYIKYNYDENPIRDFDQTKLDFTDLIEILNKDSVNKYIKEIKLWCNPLEDIDLKAKFKMLDKKLTMNNIDLYESINLKED